MKFLWFCFLLLIAETPLFSQESYMDSLRDFRKNYIQTHEVVKGDQRSNLDFFPIDLSYRVTCTFQRTPKGKWFAMSTSTGEKDIHRKYGVLHFSIHDTALTLNVYQSQNLLSSDNYRDYLFIPFMDLSSGMESYEGGRYLECFIKDIKNGKLVLDFNKAYNPYCAYTTGYSCPVPPRENFLDFYIKAGEKKFRGHP